VRPDELVEDRERGLEVSSLAERDGGVTPLPALFLDDRLNVGHGRAAELPHFHSDVVARRGTVVAEERGLHLLRRRDDRDADGPDEGEGDGPTELKAQGVDEIRRVARGRDLERPVVADSERTDAPRERGFLGDKLEDLVRDRPREPSEGGGHETRRRGLARDR